VYGQTKKKNRRTNTSDGHQYIGNFKRPDILPSILIGKARIGMSPSEIKKNSKYGGAQRPGKGVEKRVTRNLSISRNSARSITCHGERRGMTVQKGKRPTTR